ncbi:hypothetical protein POJ06DRAFT_272136 [Lipomyces tetrasporus]|uniref:Uncharacterized protein n=1 Tax=Lipomyces tetrasporus TaxID=54092 RepID=A0AAD7QXR3_9ASCO|nr:uncharacterized protein POJ06DRAFT_272136 [Lipomyces tetrasporus]KAJ8103399.1 hypothetical protein POJ06DRAFT_272136 [Lipomyces tetrasporus]
MERPSYQRALKFLRDNEPERRLDIQLSYENFGALEKKAHVLYGDAKYPRVEYAASDSRVTIYTVPTALHSRSTVNLQEAIRDSVRDILIQHNKKESMRYILSVGETTVESANDQGTGSTKTPDAGLLFDNGHRRALTLIIEAGVSEGYRALKRDIELWLNEFQCPTCILFWLNENPRFGYPREADKYSVTEHSAFDEAMQLARNNHRFGPYSYRDHFWFGPLTKAFIEVFKRDASTRVIKNGDDLKLGPTMGDFFPDVSEIDSIRGVPIEVATNFVGHFLASAAQSTAEARFNCFVRTSKRILRRRPTAGRQAA